MAMRCSDFVPRMAAGIRPPLTTGTAEQGRAWHAIAPVMATHPRIKVLMHLIHSLVRSFARYVVLRYVPLRWVALGCVVLRCVALGCVGLRWVGLGGVRLGSVGLGCVALVGLG